MKRAYVTMICGGDSYVPGAEALGHSIVESGSREQRVAMVTSDVSQEACQQLIANGWEIRLVEPIANPRPNEELLFARFGLSFTKLRVFDFEEYDKLVFLDADTIVMRNVDHLFDHPGIAAAPDFLMPDKFNSGVMVIEPAHDLFLRLIQGLTDAPSYDGGDQGFLNWFYKDWWAMPVGHRLSSAYNMHHFIFQVMAGHPALREQCLREVKIVHYTLQKPWMSVTVTGAAQLWWEKFYGAHPEQNTAWRRKMHQLQDWSFDSMVSAMMGG